MMGTKLYEYLNGNTLVKIYSDGTRTLEYEKEMKLDYPLNIDIRVSTSCSFGQRPDGSYVLCDFCHEEAQVNGRDCDYEYLKSKLKGLPKGIELAIGCNHLNTSLLGFLTWCTFEDYICNLTINQGHLSQDKENLLKAIEYGIVKGIGISYRASLPLHIPKFLLEYENTVFHVIAGIDNVQDVLKLKNKGVNKLLILGEKDFGFNVGKVLSKDLEPWYYGLFSLVNTFPILSFDNLALDQLNVRRLFLTQESFDEVYQGEYSFYINAVDKYFSPFSRSFLRTSMDNYNIKDYFKKIPIFLPCLNQQP